MHFGTAFAIRVVAIMFTDEIEITFKAGDGGVGLASFLPGKKSGPDGGSGGGGGDILIFVSNQI